MDLRIWRIGPFFFNVYRPERSKPDSKGPKIALCRKHFFDFLYWKLPWHEIRFPWSYRYKDLTDRIMFLMYIDLGSQNRGLGSQGRLIYETLPDIVKKWRKTYIYRILIRIKGACRRVLEVEVPRGDKLTFMQTAVFISKIVEKKSGNKFRK